jgi:hypothetical protein
MNLSKITSAVIFLLVIAINANAKAPELGNNSKQIKNELAKCSGHYILLNSSLKSKIITLGSEENNEFAFQFNKRASLLFGKIGSTIEGDDFELMSEAYFNSQISKFNSEKSSLGATQAKQNIMSDMAKKSTSCFELLNDPKINRYATAVLGKDQIKLFNEYMSQQSPN